MTETLQSNGLWHVSLIIEDLVNQTDLSPDDLEFDFGCFTYKKRRVIVSHIFNEHLVVSMEGEQDQDLERIMESFSTVVSYNPFCKYILLPHKVSTYEWDKLNPDERYRELSSKETVSELTRL